MYSCLLGHIYRYVPSWLGMTLQECFHFLFAQLSKEITQYKIGVITLNMLVRIIFDLYSSQITIVRKNGSLVLSKGIIGSLLPGL